ncbi:methylcrotonoyl-CoA carboxylase subunit alpha [Citrus sinensis]|nr:methylcrotonoyl-CoA carboxylase subunit alpha [Citrus sinensis]
MSLMASTLRRKPNDTSFILQSRLFSVSKSGCKSDDKQQRIEKILIANRGEIACRIMRTAKRLGIRTVAVYSDADRDSLHVKSADEAIRIGPPPARLSYLNGSSIVDAAIRTGAQAIHPGYGFLSESADFAQLCGDNGLTFIGPPVSAIRDMGDKSASKRIMGAAGVPLVPGYHGNEQDIDLMKSEAAKIGYPILIKPTHGGGGKGMRIVQSPNDFVDSFLGAQREAAASFGINTILLEKYITQPRHIEVQIFGDKYGKVLHLYERDCSVQRRHQKIIEEAPAPNVTHDFRALLGQAAVSAAKVEHPVTEMIVDQDLVEWQIRVANGEPLPLSQSEVPLLVRVETGVEQGDTVSMHYDPMIAKLVVWGENRAAALVKLKNCLSNFEVAGVPTNINFLQKLAKHRAFESGDVETHFIEQHKDELFVKPSQSVSAEMNSAARLSATLVAACIFEKEKSTLKESPPGNHCLLSIWYTDPPFRVHHHARRIMEFEWENEHDDSGSKLLTLTVTYQADGNYLIEMGEDGSYISEVKATYLGEHKFRVEFDVVSMDVHLAVYNKGRIKHIHAWHGLHHHHFKQKLGLELPDEDETQHKTSFETATGPPGSVLSPMAGLVVKVLANDGTKVEEGQPILVLEAMKMEHVVKAPTTGVVHGLQVTAGQQVSDGSVLFRLQAVHIQLAVHGFVVQFVQDNLIHSLVEVDHMLGQDV